MFYAFVSVFSFSVAGLTGTDHKVHAALLSKGDSIKDGEVTANPQATDLMTKLMNIAKIFAGFVLAISVIVIVYGGLKYVMSQGDSKAAEQGKMLIIYSGIGIFVALSAFIVIKMFQGFAG